MHGIYGVPIEISAKVSIDISVKYSEDFDKIFLVCFRDFEYDCYKKYFDTLK